MWWMLRRLLLLVLVLLATMVEPASALARFSPDTPSSGRLKRWMLICECVAAVSFGSGHCGLGL